jgi:hypothetical protein
VKVNYLTLLAAAMVLLSAAAVRADETPTLVASADATAAAPAPTTTASVAPAAPAGEDRVAFNDDSDPVREFILRSGAWLTHFSGSPTKVDEYDNRGSSAFADLEGIMSNGDHSLDFGAQMNDNETDNGRLHYYGGPAIEADLGFERFQHQLDAHDYAGWNYLGQNNTVGPLYVAGGLIHGSGPTNPQNPGNVVLYSENNLAPGQNFAIRVQEWKANFKGNITDNLKWRLNVFGIDKEGYRQVNEFQHCSSGALNGSTGPNGVPLTAPSDTNLTSQCHVTSQAQHIDWKTTEVTPVLELRMGPDATLEYSHTIRAFTANDQDVLFPYGTAVGSYSVNTHFSATSGSAGYGIVPDSQTQIDRLKFGAKIGCNTDVYLLGYAGYNEDELRDTYRNFQGTDLRVTNKSLESHTLTFAGKYYHETSTTPVTPLSPNLGTAAAPYAPQTDFYQEPSLSGIAPQVGREVETFGVNDRWRPFQDEVGTYLSRLAFVSGYEFSSLKRENANYALTTLTGINTVNGEFVNNSIFTQPSSNTNTFVTGMEENWSSHFSTFLRYKYILTDYPLYGFTSAVGQINSAFNSSLPTNENRVEVGCTWTPSDTLMINATVYLENAANTAPYVNWTSNSVPFTFSAWWMPSETWSFSFGAAEMDSWINQNVTLANLGAAGGTSVPVPWQYLGVADVINFSARYRATERLSFLGELEFVHGENSSSAVVNPNLQSGNAWTPYGNPPYATYNIGQYSLVKMASYRVGLGADYRVTANFSTYARYNYYDYQDDSGTTSGTLNAFLLGASAKF